MIDSNQLSHAHSGFKFATINVYFVYIGHTAQMCFLFSNVLFAVTWFLTKYTNQIIAKKKIKCIIYIKISALKLGLK